jgi:hypothetical protein
MRRPSCWYAQAVPVAAASLDLVQDEQRITPAAQLLDRLEELGTHVVVAAFTLDRLSDEAGNVSEEVANAAWACARARASATSTSLQVNVEREAHDGHLNARPVELREPGTLDVLPHQG